MSNPYQYVASVPESNFYFSLYASVLSKMSTSALNGPETTLKDQVPKSAQQEPKNMYDLQKTTYHGGPIFPPLGNNVKNQY